MLIIRRLFPENQQPVVRWHGMVLRQVQAHRFRQCAKIFQIPDAHVGCAGSQILVKLSVAFTGISAVVVERAIQAKGPIIWQALANVAKHLFDFAPRHDVGGVCRERPGEGFDGPGCGAYVQFNNRQDVGQRGLLQPGATEIHRVWMVGRLPLQVGHCLCEMHRVLSGACTHLQDFAGRIENLTELLQDRRFVVLTSLRKGQVGTHRAGCFPLVRFAPRWNDHISNWFTAKVNRERV